jgi:hypothetical protein
MITRKKEITSIENSAYVGFENSIKAGGLSSKIQAFKIENMKRKGLI